MTLPYRLYVPDETKKPKSHPVILFLHGSGERGDDNAAQLNHVVKIFARPEFQKKYPCFVIVPQCPEGEGWTDWRRKAPPPLPAPAMRLALRCLDEVMVEFKVDPNRVYIGGLSMGGFGTWDCLTRFPGRFAAAIVCCGGGHPEKVTRATAKVPTWVFHSIDDGAVPVDLDRKMVTAMTKKGGKPRYTEYEAVGHNCWDPAFAEPKLMPWLFRQKRGPHASPRR